jgi:hypothetical protein
MDRVVTKPNIAAAIRRSRDFRAALNRKRRYAIAACACVIVGGGLGLSIAGVTPNAAVEAAVGKSKSLAQLLSQRSPGQRTQAELRKLKRARALAKVRIPHEAPPAPFELAKILMAPEQPTIGSTTPVALLEKGSSPTLDTIVSPPPGGSIIVPPEGGGVIVTPPGGGGGSPPPGGDQPGTPTPPGGPDTPPGGPEVPPVPEPSTWATMLLGFAFIGWRVRHQKTRAANLLHA